MTHDAGDAQISEVLEHLQDPDRGLAECARVAREWVLISTPWEPAWRMLNMARGLTLTSLARLAGGKIPTDKLQAIVAELEKL